MVAPAPSLSDPAATPLARPWEIDAPASAPLALVEVEVPPRWPQGPAIDWRPPGRANPAATPRQPRGNPEATPARTRGEQPDWWQSRYIHECYAQSRTRVTWPRTNPLDRTYSPACCYSWRHRGVCQTARFCEDRDRIASALERYDPDDLVYLVCTFDPKEWDEAGYRPSRALDPERRAKANHAQITTMFGGLYNSWKQFYIGRQVRNTSSRTGIRDEMDCLGYVSTAEVMRRGWPHLNVILVAPGLAKRVREETSRIWGRMQNWKRFPGWSPRERRSMLLSKVAETVLPTLQASGFGRCSLEPVRSKEKLAAYIAKLAMQEELPEESPLHADGDNVVRIPTEFAKLTQVPYSAPPNFRRLRSSRHFLDPLPSSDGTRCGCLVSRSGQLVAGKDYPEREHQATAIAGYHSDSDGFAHLARQYDEAHQKGHVAARLEAHARLPCSDGRPGLVARATKIAAEMTVLPDDPVEGAQVFDEYGEQLTPRLGADDSGTVAWIEGLQRGELRGFEGELQNAGEVASAQLDRTLRKRRGESEPRSWWQFECKSPPNQADRDDFRWLLAAEAERRAAKLHPDHSKARAAWEAEGGTLVDDVEWLREECRSSVDALEIAEQQTLHAEAGDYLETHAMMRSDWERAELRRLWLGLRSPQEHERDVVGLRRAIAAALAEARFYRNGDVERRLASKRAADLQVKLNEVDVPRTPPTAAEREDLIAELQARAMPELHADTYVVSSVRRPIDAEAQVRRDEALACRFWAWLAWWALAGARHSTLIAAAYIGPPVHDESKDPRVKWRAIVPRDMLEPARPDPEMIAGLL